MIRELFFNNGPAISMIFQIGFEPKENRFYELTHEQYKQLRADGEDISEVWYMLLSKEYKQQPNETMIVNEQQKESLLTAAKIIESYCEKTDQVFHNYDDKLSFVSNLLPPVFTSSSKFKKRYLQLVK